jgi:hypothetical protein
VAILMGCFTAVALYSATFAADLGVTVRVIR